VTAVDDVLEMPDGHHAKVLSVGSTSMRVEYDDGFRDTIARPEEPYLCKTCNTTVQVGEKHEHGCPLEPGDTCGARRCNETGSCQA
jgi:hypothetical protein